MSDHRLPLWLRIHEVVRGWVGLTFPSLRALNYRLNRINRRRAEENCIRLTGKKSPNRAPRVPGSLRNARCPRHQVKRKVCGCVR